MSAVGTVDLANPCPAHAFVGFPVVTMEFVIPVLTDAVAVETRADIVENGGGGPPLPCPDVGSVQVASDCPGVQAAAEDATNVS